MIKDQNDRAELHKIQLQNKPTLKTIGKTWPMSTGSWNRELEVRMPHTAHKCEEMTYKKSIKKIEVNEKKTMPDSKGGLEVS